MKTSNGVPPRRVQVPGSIASLNDGLHASLIKTLDGFAAATGTTVRTAAVTTAATPVALSRLRTDPPFLGPQTLSDLPPLVNAASRAWRVATKKSHAPRYPRGSNILRPAKPAASRAPPTRPAKRPKPRPGSVRPERGAARRPANAGTPPANPSPSR